MYPTLALSALSLLCGVTSVQASDVWTVNCGILSSQMADPIVSPGVPSSHVHAISGGTAFKRSMPGIDSAVNANQTTCDKFTDHSNYVCLLFKFKHKDQELKYSVGPSIVSHEK